MYKSYRVISASRTSELEELVNREILNGWIPIGGVAVAPELPDKEYTRFFFQAIIRKPE